MKVSKENLMILRGFFPNATDEQLIDMKKQYKQYIREKKLKRILKDD
jgi:hypothetical protein